jgi:hypothetical protein
MVRRGPHATVRTMGESILSGSDTARHRRWILLADIASAILLVATGTLCLVGGHTMTGGYLSAGANLVSRSCAAGAAVLLIGGLWLRPAASRSLLSPILDESQAPEQLRAQRVMRALGWKLMVIRSAGGVIVLQATLLGVSAFLPL